MRAPSPPAGPPPVSTPVPADRAGWVRVAASKRYQADSVYRFTMGGGYRDLWEAEIELPRREMSMLECLVVAQGRLVPKGTLLDHAYGTGADVEESVVEVYVSRLRRRLKPFGVQIKAQRGLGYQLIAEPAE